ncbi:MAG: energy transducer TonB [Pseudomonadota bacterium]
MRRLTILFFAFGSAIVLFAGETNAAPKPTLRRAPPFPPSCQLRGGEDEERVSVGYDIDKDGNAINPRIKGSTNNCFNEAALAAVRSWRFEKLPRRGSEFQDAETIIVFRIDQATEASPFAQRKPLKRVPPNYPERCMRAAKEFESVFLKFDLLADGTTSNITVTSSTNSCLEGSAKSSVRRWIYEPAKEGEDPTETAQVVITFQLAGAYSYSQASKRNRIRKRLRRISRDIEKERYVQALAALNEFEAERIEDMDNEERSFFYRLRGTAKLNTNDFVGALDDFYLARIGASGDARTSLNKVIESLEQAIDDAIVKQNEANKEPEE